MERIMWSVSRYVYKPLLEPFFRTRSPSGVLPHLDTFAHNNFVVFTINPARKHSMTGSGMYRGVRCAESNIPIPPAPFPFQKGKGEKTRGIQGILILARFSPSPL
jgi:hypothetical protein